MKRNFLTLSLAALIGLTSVASAAAEAPFERTGSSKKSTKVISRKTTSPLDKRRAAKDAAKHNPLLGAPSGMLAIKPFTETAKPANHLTRSIEAPRGHFIGNVCDFTGMQSLSQAFMGEIDLATGNVSRLFTSKALINGNDYDFQGGAVRDGIFYTPVAVSSIDGGTIIRWNAIDIETGNTLTPINFGADAWSAYAYSMTYDPKNDLFYCLCIDSNLGQGNMLSVIDAKNGFNVISSKNLRTSLFIGALAYCPADEKVYAFADDGSIYTVRADSNQLTSVGTFLNDECPVTTNVTLPICYSPLDEAFVFQVADSYNHETRIGFFALDEWEIFDNGLAFGGDVKVPYFASLSCLDKYAVNEAPELPAAPEINFDKASLSGSVTITAPKMNYGGIALPEGTKMPTVMTIDGNEVFNKELAAGESATIDQTLTQGMHVFSVVCTLDGKASPSRDVKKYIGYDTPVAPTGLKLTDTTLTWNAVGGIGANKGYVDAEAITYDVFFNNVKMNEAPLTECTYTFATPEKLAFTNISVKASANDLTSAAATIGEVIGKALELPIVMDPEVAEADLFQVLNPDNDDVRFGFAPIDLDMGRPVFMCLTSYYNSANDWLFMPLINFRDNSHLYNLCFTAAEAYVTGQENFDVYLTKKVTTDRTNMTNIFSVKDTDLGTGRDYSVNFAAPENGDYYIAFHCTSNAVNGSGISLYDFAVNALDLSSDVPASPQVTITPAPLGALKAQIDITAPTVNTVGTPLDASKEITFEITSGARKAEVKALPGATATAEMAVSESGYNEFVIVPSNENGKGIERKYLRYIGMDRPLCPTNIKGVPTSDNLGLVLTWDKPGNVGPNGGYVDTDALNYRIYNVQGVSFYPIATTDKLTYEFRPLESIANAQQLDRYVTGPSAFNEIGESSESLFVQDVLGTPYLLPMKEEFNGFIYKPIYFNESGECQGSAFNNITTIMADIFKHNCTVDALSGALQFYNTASAPRKAELYIPKFSTKGEKEVVFTLRYLDYAYAPPMHIYGRCDGTPDPVLLGDITPAKPVNGEWKDVDITLPANFIDKGWVQIIFRADLSTNYDEYGFIDSYTISNNADVDMAVRSISGPAQIFAGEKSDYIIDVVNGGNERVYGKLLIDLLDKDGNALRHEERTLPRLASMANVNAVFELEMREEYADVSPLTLRGTVELEGDEVEWNNTYDYSIEVRPHQAPVVKDLSGKWNDGESSVALNWSEPSTKYGNLEAFEMLNNLSKGEKLGCWKNYDLDEALVFGFTKLETLWPGMTSEPSAWTVIDTSILTPFRDDATGRMVSHSGNKYIMARTPSYDTNDPMAETTQANDWLVSPQVVGGSDLTFWIGTPDGDMTEYLELWVSSTDDTVGNFIDKPSQDTSVGATCGSFRYVRTFDKSGSDTWEKVTVTLPEDAKYFALVYRSFDSFAVMLDDIEFEQADPANYEIDHYAVYRILDNDWSTFTFIGDTKTTSFVDTEVGNSHNPTYFVTTYVKSDGQVLGGPRSNYFTVNTLGVDGIEDNQAVVASKGVIVINGFAGNNAKIYTADGKLVRDANLNNNTEVFYMEAGIYMVQIGKKSYKVMVK